MVLGADCEGALLGVKTQQRNHRRVTNLLRPADVQKEQCSRQPRGWKTQGGGAGGFEGALIPESPSGVFDLWHGLPPVRLRVCAQLKYVCFKYIQAAACVPSPALSFYPGRSAGMFDLSAGPSRLCFYVGLQHWHVPAPVWKRLVKHTH